MSLFDLLGIKQKNSASKARERLKIIVAHERAANQAQMGAPDYLPSLQQELLEVVRKYVDIADDQVKISMEKRNELEVLELNIALTEADKNDLNEN